MSTAPPDRYFNSLISGLPPEVLSKLPAVAPPPGVTSNFVNPVSRGWVLTLVSSILAGMMIICYAIRVYTRFAIVRRLTWCDFTLLMGFLSALVVYIDVLLCVTGDGMIGTHVWDISLYRVFTKQNLIGLWIASWTDAVALGFVKLSIFIMYLELFVGLRWMQICVWIGASLSSAFYVALTIAQLYFGTPFHGETWASHIFSARTLRATILSVPMSSVGLGIDVYLFLLPLIAVSKLHLPMRKRIPVFLMFSVGLLACIGSLLSIYYRVQFLQNDDITWNLLNVRLMLNVELYIGIMLCCLQPMAIFFYKYRNRFSSAISGLALGLASGITCCLCCGSGSRSSANSDATVDEKQDPSVALPARARLPEPNLYPGLDLTTPSELERGGFRRSHLNSMDIRTNHSGGANSIPSHELLHWA
ncbi:hypothetical protein MFRU_004g02650 [Monilinia fructicola]|nr:hypothetical protein MFRU_004g02650 [Monilinia fructicola]